MIVLVLFALLGCPKHAQGEAIDDGATSTGTIMTPTGHRVPAGPWAEDGLSLQIPAGWRATTGAPGTDLVLTLEDPDSGVRVDISAWPQDGAAVVPPREGCTAVFADETAWRTLPGLHPTLSASCVPEDADGAVVQGWYAVVGGREIAVEAIYPPGRLVEGRRAVEVVLRGLRTTTTGGVSADDDASAPR